MRSKELKLGLHWQSTTSVKMLSMLLFYNNIVLQQIIHLVSPAAFISKYFSLVLILWPPLYKIITFAHRVLILYNFFNLVLFPASPTCALYLPTMVIPKPFESQQGNDATQVPSYFCFCFSLLPQTMWVWKITPPYAIWVIFLRDLFPEQHFRTAPELHWYYDSWRCLTQKDLKVPT